MINKKLDLIMIDPFDQSVSRVDVIEKPIGECLHSIKEHMQCDLIDVIPLGAGVILIIDDEGRLINNNRWFTLGSSTFAGKCMLANTNEDGDTLSCKRSVDEVFKLTNFLEEGYSEEPYMEFKPLD